MIIIFLRKLSQVQLSHLCCRMSTSRNCLNYLLLKEHLPFRRQKTNLQIMCCNLHKMEWNIFKYSDCFYYVMMFVPMGFEILIIYINGQQCDLDTRYNSNFHSTKALFEVFNERHVICYKHSTRSNKPVLTSNPLY